MEDKDNVVEVTSPSALQEETIFKWSIKNFLTKIEALPEGSTLSVDFDIGGRIGCPSKWRLTLGRRNSSENWKQHNVFLELTFNSFGEGAIKKEMELKLNCEAKIKAKDNSGKDIISVGLWRKGKTDFGTPNTLERNALVEDALVIHLKFVISDINLDKGPFVSTMMEHSRHGLSTNFGSLLDTGYNSDFVIQVKSTDGQVAKLEVHKNILGLRSPVFRKMLEAPMLELETGTMVIEDLSLECVKMMLKWMYVGRLDAEWRTIAQELVVASDKYDLPCLRSFLDKYLHHACKSGNALKLSKLARLYGLGTAIKNVTSFIKVNIEEILELDRD